jgi:ABC-2 type transport system permease protein
MLIDVARFEARYILRNPLLWVTLGLTFAMFIAAMSVDGFELGNEGGLLKNAAVANAKNYVMISVLFMFVTVSFVANAVLRDDETGYGPIIRSTGLSRLEYVFGRFLGGFAVAAVCMLVVPLGTVIGTMMPWAPQELIGPNRLADHLYGYFLIALPNLFAHAAVFFALATLTRSMMPVYLAAIGFVAGFFTLQSGFVGNTIIPVAQPFAGRAISRAVRYWTVAERNVGLPELGGALLYNRLLWVGIAVLGLALVAALYRFADRGVTKRERKRLKLVQPSPEETARAVESLALPAPEHGPQSLSALLRMRTWFEVRQVVLSPAFVIVLAWGLWTITYILADRAGASRPTYPTTLSLIPDLKDAFSVILLVIAMFYAGELVWRERDRRIHEIIDATPLPNWAYVVPKTLAMAIVLIGMVLVNVGAAVTFQLTSGYTDIELGKYFLWYVLPATWDVLVLAALAIFVQSVSPHKTIGWAVMVAFLVWQIMNTAIDHNLVNFGSTPGMPLSDMNGAGSFWKGAWVVRVYWGAFAALLLVAAHLLWRRGTEVRLRPRLAGMRRRLTGGAGVVASGAVAVLLVAGAYAFYNIHVLNGYRSPLAGVKHQVAFEKKYWKYFGMPQPTVAKVTARIDVYPEERRAITKGRYLLRNLTSQPISDVHVRLVYDDLELTRARIEGARLIVDDGEFDYRIFRLDSPMRPGEERVLDFETRRWHRGFRNGQPNTRLIENGTFLSKDELAPVIGMGREGTLEDSKARRIFGLPARDGRAKLEDLSATAIAADLGGWTTSDITLSTVSDQTPLAPGRKVSDIVSGGRRTARFVSEAPIRDKFSVQSARYEEKKRNHNGIELAVYYHPKHSWNVDRMLDGMVTSLDYFQPHFGPYQFRHARIVEYPGFTSYAQAFAGTIAYSEASGFTADMRNPKIIDHVAGNVAHELAHQYWGHQVTPADMEGSLLLVESLANYSATIILRQLGDNQIHNGLKYLLNNYLAGRAGYGTVGEPPLIRVESQNYIFYNKGALALYLLRERLGEDAVNRALRSLLERYRFKAAPYPRSVDLVQALRAEARTDEEQNLITDLFERVVLWDLKVNAPTAVQRADGKWDVTVPVEAKKYEVDKQGGEAERTLAENIEVGLFAAKPGSDGFSSKDVIVFERRPIRSGQQVLRFVSDRRPTHAGVDPYNYYIDRNSGDNVLGIVDSD